MWTLQFLFYYYIAVMKNKEMIIEKLMELRQTIEHEEINNEDLLEELIEIELQIQNYL